MTSGSGPSARRPCPSSLSGAGGEWLPDGALGGAGHPRRLEGAGGAWCRLLRRGDRAAAPGPRRPQADRTSPRQHALRRGPGALGCLVRSAAGMAGLDAAASPTPGHGGAGPGRRRAAGRGVELDARPAVPEAARTARRRALPPHRVPRGRYPGPSTVLLLPSPVDTPVRPSPPHPPLRDLWPRSSDRRPLVLATVPPGGTDLTDPLPAD